MDYSIVVNDTSDVNSSYVNGTERGNRTFLTTKPNDSGYYTVALVLSWTNALLIIGLNSAVIVTILRYKKRSRLYFLLLNLAIADLLTGIIDAVPQSIERTIGMSHFTMIWVFGEAMCKIQRTLSNTSMTASNYILAATSFDRAMVIFRPMTSFRRGHILQKCVIVGCWVFGILVSSPLLKLMKLKLLQSTDDWYYCSVDWGDQNPLQMWKILLVAMFVYIFVIPFFIIVISYTILLVSIYRRTMASKSFKKQSPIAGTHVFNRGLPKSKIKSIKLTCGIVLGFLISWIVFFVFMFLNIFTGLRHGFVMLAVTFYYWSSVANPILFFIYHRRRPRPSSATSTYSSETCRNTFSSELRLSTNVKGNSSFSCPSPTRSFAPEIS